MIIIPIKWLFHWEYIPYFQTNPYFIMPRYASMVCSDPRNRVPNGAGHQHAEHCPPLLHGTSRDLVVQGVEHGCSLPANKSAASVMAKAMQHGLCPNPGRSWKTKHRSKCLKASLQSRSLQLTTCFHAANLE